MKTRLVWLAVVGLVSFSIGRFLTPPEVEVKEIEKVVYREATDTKKHVVVKETRTPDGTIVKETVSTTDRKSDKFIDRETESIHVASRPDWRLNLDYTPRIPALQSENAAISIQRRLLSELYLGLSVSTRKEIGLSISLGF